MASALFKFFKDGLDDPSECRMMGSHWQMKLVFLTPARKEYERKLARIALRPFTTHSVEDFIDDIERLEAEILLHPGLRSVANAPAGYYRSDPSKIYSHFLIHRIHEKNAVVVAVAAPERRPLYWRRGKIQASP